MPTIIKQDGEYAVENSTYVVQADFFDEDNQSVVPSSIKWSLTDPDGNVINGRDQVVVNTPAATIYIVLSDADLALSTGFAGASELRHLLIEALYNSARGNDLTLKDSLIFPVRNLVKITA